MKYYNISEAIAFLAQEYGAENMPTSEETLRRAIRTRKLRVKEEGDPGKRGYSIEEDSLRAYAQERMDRIRLRGAGRRSQTAAYVEPPERGQLVQFPDLYGRYVDGKITSEAYYRALFTEKTKWEQIMYKKQEHLAKLDAERRITENEIQNCRSAIDAYMDGISKYNPT